MQCVATIRPEHFIYIFSQTIKTHKILKSFILVPLVLRRFFVLRTFRLIAYFYYLTFCPQQQNEQMKPGGGGH